VEIDPMRPLALTLLLALSSLAADPPTLDEQIKTVNLSDAEARALKRYGFVVRSAEWRQVFSPYIGGRLPRFITTDSLLNAFHVVFEESVFRLELANARKLPTILADIERNLPAAEKALADDAELTKAAGRRARVFLGTARALLDPKALPADAYDRTLVEAEVKRVTAATGTSKPDWLGPPDKGFLALDYSRFKPRGFYTRTPRTEAYFRAVSWLQAIPWRLDNDEEFAGILLLAHAHTAAKDRKGWVGAGYWGTFEKFLGTRHDWQLPDAGDYLPVYLSGEMLAKRREQALNRARKQQEPLIHDQLRLPPDTPDGKPEVGFRFVSAYRLPDAVLLQRTAARDRLPSGLDVAVALGSPFARKWLEKDSAAVLKRIDTVTSLFPPRAATAEERASWNLYAAYLDCLRALLERTEEDAPPVFHSEAWGAKTCQTALGGWAQMRHTWVLQAKQDELYFSSFRSAGAGFVEPVPNFYARFAEVVKRSGRLFEAAGAFDVPSRIESVFTKPEAEVAKAALDVAYKGGLSALTADQREVLTKAVPQLPADGDPWKDTELSIKLEEARRQVLLALDDEYNRRRSDDIPDAKSCWRGLEHLAITLEPLAQKQLRGEEWSKDEAKFILGYGTSLAHVMFYGGNSYSDPKDDAPRIVDVHSRQGNHLSVGIGRPRTVWVVYPWKGSDVLCRGAVLPYHEFASGERLTDTRWRELLDSPQAPEQPEWVSGWAVPKAK
jgi:hypothetical protein